MHVLQKKIVAAFARQSPHGLAVPEKIHVAVTA
jgi:hypothetical protein